VAGPTRGIWIVAALAAVALAVSGLAAASASAESVWLCKPGLAKNPCESSEKTTVELGNGSTLVESPKLATNPPIDCFYVYPTVSSEITMENGLFVNANLLIGPEETQIAIDQASRFSQTCKVYAPMYPQLTLAQINTPGDVTPAASEKAYLGLLSAWQEYLAKYNDGRGVMLIGHSQGALLLEQLIKEQIDPNPALRKQLVSAELMGGNVLVPKGKTVGATFTNVPSCQSAAQTGCVVAYSSFLSEPPEGAFFGRDDSPLLETSLSEEELKNDEVLCVNPAELSPGNYPGALLRYESTTPFPGLLGLYFQSLKGSTPWVSMPEQYSGRCERVNGATWLQLNDVGPEGDPRTLINEPLGPLWGTHLEDVNVALGNLVGLTATQSRAYLEKVQVASISPTFGPTGGGTAVTIKGSGLLAGATVTIGNAAASVNVVSETEITATTTASTAGPDEVVVTDANGTSSEGPSYTYYLSPPPTVVTGLASSVRSGSATLNATVNPTGGAASECKLEYGTTALYGKSAVCTSLPGSGESPVAVSAPVRGLVANTTYHFRISATNPTGTTYGADQTFTTALALHYYKNAYPAGRLPEGERIPVLSWGTVTLTPQPPSQAGPTTCEDSSGGFVENPQGAIAGRGQTSSFSAWNCANAGCPAGAEEFPPASGKVVEKEAVLIAWGERYAGQSLPWPSELFEAAGKVRSESTGLVLELACVASKTAGQPGAGGREDEPQYLAQPTLCSTTPADALAPLMENGKNLGPSQSKLSFDKESGDLLCRGPGANAGEEVSFEGATSGSLRIMGYKGSEVIIAK